MKTKTRIIRDSSRANAEQISSNERRRRSRTKLTLRCFLWLYCCAVNPFHAVNGHGQAGCSFSSEDWCGYSNVYDGTDGPKWQRQDRSASSGRHATLYGRHPMLWPPKSGHFLYTGPTQNERMAEKSAELKSPVVQVNGSSTCLYFSYHNQVPIRLSPTLVVIRRNANSSTSEGEFQEGADVVLAEFYSLTSEKWFEAAVRLPEGEYSVVFSGRNYNSRTMSGGGPVAIANVAIAEGKCDPGVVPERLRAPGDCGFEAGLESCGYRYADDSGVQAMRILAESLSPSEQAQRGARRPPSDHFLAMTDRFYEIATQGSKARILSPQISIPNEGCLLLWYYNSVRATQESNNAFNILKSSNSNETLLFRLPVPRSNRDRWYQLSAALPRGDYHLLFEFVYTSDFSDNDYVGLDSVEVYNRTCTSVQSTADVCDTNTDNPDPICKNGGSCLNTGKKHFRCLCREDYYGTLCEHMYKCATGSSDVCQNGGTCLPDGKVSSTCRCPVGFEGRRCENVTSCGSPEQVLKNARLVSFTNETYGSTAMFECDVGWMKYGYMTGQCNAQGIWEIRGKCLWVNCPEPPIFPHATIVSVTNRTLNGLVRYKCEDGMAMDYERDYLVCRSQESGRYYSDVQEVPDVQTGYWLNRNSNWYITCYHIPRCSDPPSVPNAETDVTNVTKNGVATYRCKDEYEMNGNRSEFEIKCSSSGNWVFYNQKTGQSEIGYEERIRQVCQCLKTPNCGSPPKVPHSTVNCTDTALNSTAVYACKAGYRLVGSELAICAKVGDDRQKRWIEWLFVPTCEFTCPMREGRRGNYTVARYQVSHCVLTEKDTSRTTLKCDLPVTYSVKRADLNKAQDRRGQQGVFYGNDLCFSERSTTIRSFEKSVLYERKRCRAVCLQGVSEVREIIVRDEFTSSSSLLHYHTLGVSSTERKFTTTRKQTILRYDFLERQ